MLRSVSDLPDDEEAPLCRLCLAKEEDLICIFDPCGYHGFRLWEIIKELLQVEASKEDGLPWTICKECVEKVKEFKQFKTMCIHTKITFLTMITNRGLVLSMRETTPTIPSSQTRRKPNDQVEGVLRVKEETPVTRTDGYPAEEVTVSSTQRDEGRGRKSRATPREPMEAVHKRPSMRTSRKYSDEVEVVEVVMEGTPTVPTDEDSPEEEFPFAGKESNGCHGGKLSVKVETSTSESSPEEGTTKEENSSGDESSDEVASNDATSPLETGDLVSVKEEAATSESSSEAETAKEENRSGDESSDEEASNDASSSLETGDLVPDCGMTGIIAKTSEKIVGDLREERKKTAKETKINNSPCGLPGDHSLRSICTLTTLTSRHQMKNKFSAKEREHLKSKDYMKNTVACIDILPNDQRCFNSHETRLSGRVAYICDYCGMKYTDKNMLVLHIRECISRKRSSMTSVPKDLHTKSTESRELTQFLCEICEKVFRRKCHLTNHLNSHKGLKTFKCEICGKEFKCKRSLKLHATMHSECNAFKCDSCGKVFNLKSQLVRHLLVHSGLRPFKCDICGKGFTRKTHVVQHSLMHSGLRPFKCDICGKGFAHKTHLVRHSLMHSRVRPFKCDTCGKEFNQKCHLVAHSGVHSGLKPFKCDTCGKGFSGKSYLLKHSAMHSGLKPFKCDICGKGFPLKSSLLGHSLVHGGLRPFKCVTCGKGFALQFHLVRHSLVHSRLRPFKCDTCGEEFNQKCNLIAHSGVHSGLKPYKCDTCGKGLGRKSDLVKHLLVHSRLRP